MKPLIKVSWIPKTNPIYIIVIRIIMGFIVTMPVSHLVRQD